MSSGKSHVMGLPEAQVLRHLLHNHQRSFEVQLQMDIPVPLITSESDVSYQDIVWGCESGLRGRGGRIARLPLAWKAATRTAPGRASLLKALCTTGLDRTDAAGLLMAGKLEERFVEKVRFEAAARQVWRSIAGRTIEAIFKSCDPSRRNG